LLEQPGSDIVQLNLIQRHLREGLGNEFNHVIVIDDLVDIALVIRAGEDNDLTFIANQLVEFLKFIQEDEPIYNGHVNVQKNQAGKLSGIILILL